MRRVIHLGNGRWWDPDAHAWRTDRGRIARRERFGLADVRTTYVVLACAHLDHDPGNNTAQNLSALCQRCHMLHDADEHRWQRWWNAFRRRAVRDLFEEPPATRRRMQKTRRDRLCNR